MAADPRYSAGARLERASFLRMIRRRINRKPTETIPLIELDVLTSIEKWVLQRQERYDKKPGGLGKGKK